MTNRPKSIAKIDSAPLASATHIWLLLWRATRAIEQNALNSISQLGLGYSDFAALEMLLHKGPQPINAIGKRVLLTSGSITAAIDRLEAKKLVRRTSDSTDRRARIVQLTTAGRRLAARAFRQHAADLEATLAVLRPTERIDLIRLLKKAGLWAESRLEKPRPHQKTRA